ncbi:7357_t:CDS:2 [Ambispora gerdemannii]|uniref:7357_t:CDS:1 n=1 Tax=Ambispora gerdemannii TaxID=144530 RepID=A0A9N9CKL4_9GLOM|nr:7357_t:CDS:2 [Ambispora gerdemannii]
MSKEIIIICLVIILIYLAYQQTQQKTLTIQPDNQRLQELTNQVQHYQTLYQKRVEKDIGSDSEQVKELQLNYLERLNNQTSQEKNKLTEYQPLLEQKIDDLGQQLIFTARQKIKNNKQAQELLAKLESTANIKTFQTRVKEDAETIENKEKKLEKIQNEIKDYQQLFTTKPLAEKAMELDEFYE